MRDTAVLGPWVRRFLLEHLVAERNLARNTQVSYRDSLTLLLPFVGHHAKSDVDRLLVEDVSADRVRAFLGHLEHDRQCSVLTRNHRLAAIHSLARYIGARSPEHAAWCAQVRLVPFKKASKTVVGYLDKPEVDALLRVPDQQTVLGARDYALMLFLYNSGARADEAASLRACNLQLGTSPSVRILGKGNKWRVCPLWPKTAVVLRPLIRDQGLEDRVVPPDQTERMVAALRERGITAEYLAFPGEQHGFRQAETIRRCLEAELAFYRRALGLDSSLLRDLG